MRWELLDGQDYEAHTTAGDWVISPDRASPGYCAFWYPPEVYAVAVKLGQYKTVGAAKRAAKRYAKRLAAAFKAFAKEGWQ